MEDATPQILFAGKTDPTASIFTRLSAEQAGWQDINMVGLRLHKGETFDISIADYEYVAVILAGQCHLTTSRGDFNGIGRRPNVFSGLPHAIYLPRQTDFTIEAITETFEMVSCWVPTTLDSEIHYLSPADITTELIASGFASVQRNTILSLESVAQRLHVYEQYTPAGNWGIYPPHKHDQQIADVEDNLHETSFFRFDRRAGFAMARLYDDDGADTSLTVIENDIIAIREGYHTFVSSPSASTYSLHFVASTVKSFHLQTDPDHRWVQARMHTIDPRLPLVDAGMES